MKEMDLSDVEIPERSSPSPAQTCPSISQSEDSEATLEISSELGPQERLLWAGHPFRGWRLRSVDTMILPFAILWSIVAIFAVFGGIETLTPSLRAASGPLNSEIADHGGILYTVFALTAVPVSAFYLTFGRFILDARRRARTWYGLSDDRIIILASGFIAKRVTNIPLRELRHVMFSQRPDGSGTICFDSGASQRPAGIRIPWSVECHQLERVPDVRRVVRKIIWAQRKM
jgi:Bacterial PH domain